MSITFSIEVHTGAELDALAAENAPFLNVHHGGGYRLLRALGIDPDWVGTIDAADLLDLIDHAPGPTAENWRQYLTVRLPMLREVAAAAERLGRGVQWG